MTGPVKFRKMRKPPPLDINTLKDEIIPGEGTEWVKRSDGTWIHAKGFIQFSQKDGLTATVYRTMRGERATLTLSGVSIGVAVAWIETQT